MFKRKKKWSQMAAESPVLTFEKNLVKQQKKVTSFL